MKKNCFNPDFSLAEGIQKASFSRLYSEAELYKAALSVWTKPLFSWKRALVRSHDGGTLYEYAKKGHRNLARLHRMLRKREFIPQAVGARDIQAPPRRGQDHPADR